MKRYLLIITVLTLFLASCDKDDNDLIEATPSDTGQVVDLEGNEYNWVRIGSLDWTTSNSISGNKFTEIMDNAGFSFLIYMPDRAAIRKELPIYGNLLKFEDALINAPEGWRLPTDEDWKDLEKALGMNASEANQIGWRGSKQAILLQESTKGPKMELKMAGIVLFKGSPLMAYYEHFKNYGYYWTSTIDESKTDSKAAYYRKLCFGKGEIGRYSTTTEKFMSVRYVRDAK